MNTLHEILNQSQNKSEDKEDECDLYGKMLAKKLKKLPESERISFMYEVDGLFLRRFSRNADFTTRTHRIERSPSTCTTYSESIPQRRLHTPEGYRVQERRLSTPTLSYFATSPPQLHQQQQEPSTSGLTYITSPQQQITQENVAPQTNTSHPAPIVIHIPEHQSQFCSSPIENSQNSISILSDVMVVPPSDDSSSQNYIVEAFKRA